MLRGTKVRVNKTFKRGKKDIPFPPHLAGTEGIAVCPAILKEHKGNIGVVAEYNKGYGEVILFFSPDELTVIEEPIELT